MAEKLLQTRIQLRYDSYDQWMATDPVLKAGEVAIATVPKQDTDGNGFIASNTPEILIKVGDGVSKYSALKFLSANAADVYGWAKQPEKPSYSASEIGGLADYISGEIQDTNTTYTIIKRDGADYIYELRSREGKDGDFGATPVATIDLSTLDTRMKTVEAAIGADGSVQQAINKAIQNLNADGKTAGTGEIISSVSQAAGAVVVETRALTADDIPELAESKITGLTAHIDAKQDTVDFADSYAKGTNPAATKATVTNAINALDKEDSAVEGEFVTAVAEENGIISVTRAALKATDIPVVPVAKVDGLEARLSGLETGKQDKLEIADEYNASTNKVATEATITKMIAGLNGAMHYVGKVTKNTDNFATDLAAAALKETYEAGDVVLWGYDEYLYDGAEWAPLGNESIYYAKIDAETAHNAINEQITNLNNSKQDNLTFDGDYSAANPVATKDSVATKVSDTVAALKYDDTNAAAGQFVTKVTEEAGIIKVERSVLKAADISDLIGMSQISGLSDALANKQDNLILDYANSETNKVITKTGLDAVIEALKKTDDVVEHQFVTAVSEENGVITVSRGEIDAANGDVKGLAAIATSGTTDDLIQGANTLVFQCGGANLGA